MVFSSHVFVFAFLPAVLAVYYLLPRRARHLGLTASSYLFYGWTNPLFMVLMASSTVVDYLCGLAMAGFAYRIAHKIKNSAPNRENRPIWFCLVDMLPANLIFIIKN